VQKTVTVSTFCGLFTSSETDESFWEKGMEFLASHGCELSQTFLCDLPISVLSRILEHASLTLKSEDSLYDFAISQIDSRPDSIGLLAYVRFEFLTTATMAQFGTWSCGQF
jgi:hypothetical protein